MLALALAIAPALPGLAASAPPGATAGWALTAVLLAADPALSSATRSALESPAADAAFPAVTLLGEAPGVAGTLAVLYLGGEKETAWEAAAAAAYAGVLVAGAKWAVGRGRPDSDAPNTTHWFAGRPGYDSFPSGHTALAFSLARVLARRYPERSRLFYLVAGLVGLSRVYLGRHYPGDVAAGALCGLYAADHAGQLPVWRVEF
ncbi:MAG TPA: phosphatase PAP2 family protein [Firmicutes bacterium]|nr:phosphatase PAP2 family protein [Bacillota bacterium]